MTMAKDVFGMTDEDIARISPEKQAEYKRFLTNTPKYRLVAEVVKSKYCTAGIKVGQRIVFKGNQIDTEATDCPLCMGAVFPLGRCLAVYFDRCEKEGRDIAAPLTGVACWDPGMEVRGLGEVLLDVRIEPVP